MARKTPGVGFYGKIRIPTIGHKAAIDAAKQIASRNGAKLHIAVSGAAYPLSVSQKEAVARALFQHPIETNHKNFIHFLSRMSELHDEFVLVCGSDRVHEYRTLLSRYNGNRDRAGIVPFSFKKWSIHEVSGRRINTSKSPLRMSRDELVRSVSATRIEQLAREGKYDEFRAYYPSMNDKETQRFFNQIRRGLSLHEELENAETIGHQGRGWGNSQHDSKLRGDQVAYRSSTEDSRLVAKAQDQERRGSRGSLREGRNPPAMSLSISRELLPQIPKEKMPDFLKHVKKQGADTETKDVDTKKLKASQGEFDINKVYQIAMSDKKEPIVVSNDDHVLDGHHRWIANHGQKIPAHVVDLPILELIRTAKEYAANLKEETRKVYAIATQTARGWRRVPDTRFDTEESATRYGNKYHTGKSGEKRYRVVEHPDSNKPLDEETKKWEMDDLIDRFSDFVCDKLGISSKPIIKRQTDNDKSFGGYHPGEKTIYLVTKNRHPMDAFRTLAHEIVHYKQDLEGRIKDVAREGATGSPIEDEANYMAGRILRWWAKTNPGHFALGSLTENVAIFVVGGPCSGKDQFIRQLKEETEFTEQDIHSLLKTRESPSSVIVNASANNLESIHEAHEILSSNGYHTSMLFVDTSDEISKLRNEQRKEKGQRVIAENVRLSKYTEAQKNKIAFAQLFGEDMKEVSNNTKFSIDLKPKIKRSKKKQKPTEISDPNPSIEPTGVGPTFGGFGRVYKPFGLAESIVKWMENPKTQERFAKKYGNLAEQKLLETAKKLNESVKDKQIVSKPRTISQIRESIDKGAFDTMGTVPGPSVSTGDPLPEGSKIYKRKAIKRKINK